MSNLGFAHAMSAAQNTSHLGELENQRRHLDWNQRSLNSAAQAGMTGTLIGTVAGAGKGWYEGRKADHEARQQQEYNDWVRAVEQHRRDEWEKGMAARAQGVQYTPEPPPVRPSVSD